MKHQDLTPEMRRTQRMRQREIIGTAIRARREKLGLTQQHLAKSLGKSVATISKIEAGTQAMDVTFLGEICALLGLDSTKLLFKSLERTAKSDYQLEIIRIFRKAVYGKPTRRRTRRRAA